MQIKITNGMSFEPLFSAYCTIRFHLLFLRYAIKIPLETLSIVAIGPLVIEVIPSTFLLVLRIVGDCLVSIG